MAAVFDESAHLPSPVSASILQSSRVFVGNLSFSLGWQDLKDYFRDTLGITARVEIISYPSGRSKGCAIAEFDTAEDAARAINTCNNTELGGRKIFLREDREQKGFAQARGGSAGRGGFTPRLDVRGPSIYDGGVVAFRGGRGGCDGRGGRGGLTTRSIGVGSDSWSINGQSPIISDFQPSYAVSVTSSLSNNLGSYHGSNNGNGNNNSNNNGYSLFVGNLSWSTTWHSLKDLFGEYGEVLRADVITDRFNGRSRGFGTVRFSTHEAAQSAIAALNDTEFEGRRIVVRQDHFTRGQSPAFITAL